MKRVLGMLMAMVMLLLANMAGASALTFSAWESEIPPLAVGEKVAEQIAEDTAVENGFHLNDVKLLRGATELVKEDGTGRPIWVVSRLYGENDESKIEQYQYNAAIDAQTGEIQYDTKFYAEKLAEWEDELQCDGDFWPYKKRLLFNHVYAGTHLTMPEESPLTLEEVRLVCDYRIQKWSGFTLSQEELDAYTMAVTYQKGIGSRNGLWKVRYYLLDANEPRYHLKFSYMVIFNDDITYCTVRSWEELYPEG